MEEKMGVKILSSFMMTLLLLGSVAPFATAAISYNNPSASGSFSNPTNDWQSSSPTFDNYYDGVSDDYWPILSQLESDQCNAVNSDFIVAIPVGGCSPTIVRSDLLAEQNVPVFCQLSAIKVNPLIDVSTINSISFKGDYPEEVAGISFHPARAAISSTKTLIGDPISQNIGYVVIVLKKQVNETSLEEFVSGMLTATVKYDAQTAFGTGAGAYYLEPMSDFEWDKTAAYSSFWGGKGYLRATKIDDDSATIEILTSKDKVLETVTLKEGETSESIYYPGQYCTASLQLKLNKLETSQDMARLNIDGDNLWVRKGDRLFDKKCIVRKINVLENSGGEIEIGCGSTRFTLTVGERIGAFAEESDISFTYGKYDYTATSPIRIDRSNRYYEKIDELWHWYNKTNDAEGIVDKINESLFYELADKAIAAYVATFGEYELSTGKYADDSYASKYVGLAEKTTLELVDNFPSEIKDTGEYFGEESLYQQIALAGTVENEVSQLELIDIFLEKYPSSSSIEYLRDLKIRLQKYDLRGSSQSVTLNNNNHNIRVEGFSPGAGASDSVNVRLNGGSLVALKKNAVYDDTGIEIVDAAEQKSALPRLTVTLINNAGARFSYVWKNDDDKVESKSFSVGNGKFYNVGGLEVLAIDTAIREVAYVSLIPTVKGTKTEANFTFKIGIEQRAIELTPEQANDKIEKLNKSIAEWEERIEKLGELVKGMKAACFGVSTVLTLKNMFAGFGGEALARGDVMDVYEKKCREEGASTSAELHVCYSKYSGEVEDSIEGYSAAVEAVNSKVKCASTEKTTSKGLFSSKVVNSSGYVKELYKCAGLSNDWEYEMDGVAVTKDHLTDARDYQAVLLREEACIGGASSACDIATEQMKSALRDNVDRIRVLNLEDETKDSIGVELSFINLNTGSRSVYYKVASNDIRISDGGTISAGSRYSEVSYVGRNYVIVLEEGTTAIENIYEYKTRKLTKIDNVDLKSNIQNSVNFVAPVSEKSSCVNSMNHPYVRYYESGNQQGFAAVVPFDINDGWYAHVDSGDYTENGVANAFWICNVGSDGMISDGVTGGDVCARFSTSIGPGSYFTPCPDKNPSQISELYTKAEAAIREANRDGNGISIDSSYVDKASPMGSDAAGIECTDFMSVDDCNLMFNVCDPVICPTSRCNMGGKFPVSDVIATGIIGSIALCLPNFGAPDEGGVVIPVCLSGIHAGLDSYVSILKSYRSCLEQNVETGEYTGICDEINAIYTCEFFWGQVSPLLDNLLPSIVSSVYGGVKSKGGAEYLTVDKAFDNLDKSVDYFTSNYAEGAFRAFNLQNTEEIGATICNAFVGSSLPTTADMLDDLLEPESPTQFYAYFSESPFTDATVPSTSQYKVYFHIYAGNDEGVQYKVYLKNPPQTSYYANNPTVGVASGFTGVGNAADETKTFTAPSGYKELCVSINGRDECGFGKVTSNFGLDYASQLYVGDQATTSGITSTEDCVTTSASAWGMVDPNLQSGIETSLGGEDIATTGLTRICASTNPEAGIVGGNEVYCKMNDNAVDGSNSKCAAGYICDPIGGDMSTNIGVCENPDGQSQISAGRWVDVGYCDTENVRCWLDSSSVSENLGIYATVNDINYVDDLVAQVDGLNELTEEYKTVREKLNRIKGNIEELPEKVVLDEKGDVQAIEEIIIELDEVAGIEDGYIGQGLNSDKAEALAIKAEVYRVVARALFKDTPQITSIAGRYTEEEIAEIEEETAEEELGGEVVKEEEDIVEEIPEKEDTVLSEVENTEKVRDNYGSEYLVTYSETIGEKHKLILKPLESTGEIVTINEDPSSKLVDYGFEVVSEDEPIAKPSGEIT